MHVDAIDHFVLTVASIEQACAFYERVLGMTTVSFGDGRKAVAFGSQKLNLHLAGREFTPRAQHPVPGSANFCFVTLLPLDDCMAHVRAQGVEILLGPVDRPEQRLSCGRSIFAIRIRISSKSPTVSLHFRPDRNAAWIGGRLCRMPA